MTTIAAINVKLGTSGMNAQIVQEAVIGAGTSVAVYALGGADVPGRAVWTVLTIGSTASTNAQAVLTALRAGTGQVS